MAWNKTKPQNDGVVSNAPSEIRANWDAIELGTDANLQITNAKVSATAGIVDTKLAQIVTASKVSGTALTGLASIPGGAGVIPTANIPSIDGAKLTGLANIVGGAGLIPDANMPATLVKLSGDQTVAGIKTFSSIPVLPASNPTTDNQAVRKLFSENASNLVSGTVPTARLGSGTPDVTKFLRGDQTWVVPTLGIIFGAWVSATKDESILATTDGIIVINGGSTGGTYSIKTDSSNPPTTVRVLAGGYGAASTGTCPVKKGEYYLIEDDGMNVASVYWIPIGS